MKQKNLSSFLRGTCTGTGLLLSSLLCTTGAQAQMNPTWAGWGNSYGIPATLPETAMHFTSAPGVASPDWVNSDMFNLYTAGSTSGSPLGYIQAVVWDDPGNNVVNIMLYNSFTGTQTKLCTIADAQHPDVVIGEEDPTSIFFGKRLVLGVVYEELSSSRVRMQTYHIDNLYGSNFNIDCATPKNGGYLSSATSGIVGSNPHIDMAPEATPVSGYPVPNLAKYVATWAENNGGNMEVYLQAGDIYGTISPSGDYVDDGERPDVAYARNFLPSNPPLNDYLGYLIYYHAGSKELRWAKVDLNAPSSPSVVITMPVDRGDVIAPPRIEAMNNTMAQPHMTLWTAVAEIKDIPTSLSEIHTYWGKSTTPLISSDLSACDVYTGPTPTLIPGNASTDNPLYSNNGFSPTVAAGNGENSGYTAHHWVGNTFYAMGWHMQVPGRPVRYDALFAPAPGPGPGLGYHEINMNPLNATAPASGTCRLAMTNSSNDGYALASAWYEKRVVGSITHHIIFTKYSGNAMAFKPADVAQVTSKNGWQVYPNPATHKVSISGEKAATYTITDISGRVVISGIMTQNVETINIGELPGGMYLLQLKAGLESTTVKLVKQ